MILMGLNGNIMVYKWFINGNISMILILMGLNGNIMVFYIMFSLWQRPRFGCSPTLSDQTTQQLWDKFCCDFHRPFACKKISIKHIITYQITIQWIGRENGNQKPQFLAQPQLQGFPALISVDPGYLTELRHSNPQKEASFTVLDNIVKWIITYVTPKILIHHSVK